jgi:hypothetical protein
LPLPGCCLPTPCTHHMFDGDQLLQQHVWHVTAPLQPYRCSCPVMFLAPGTPPPLTTQATATRVGPSSSPMCIQDEQ